MERVFEGEWFAIDVQDYIRMVVSRTQVIWLGSLFSIEIVKDIFLITHTEARAKRIQTSKDWTAFIDSNSTYGD